MKSSSGARCTSFVALRLHSLASPARIRGTVPFATSHLKSGDGMVVDALCSESETDRGL